jgi:hypothetical protein
MKNKKRYKKKELKKRLAAILMIYLEGLNNEKQKRFSKYLENKMSTVVDHYVSLLKGKKGIPIEMQQLEKISVDQLILQPKNFSENNTVTEKTSLQQ